MDVVHCVIVQRTFTGILTGTKGFLPFGRKTALKVYCNEDEQLHSVHDYGAPKKQLLSLISITSLGPVGRCLSFAVVFDQSQRLKPVILHVAY